MNKDSKSPTPPIGWDDPNWKEVARNFWFACEHGDIGFVEVLIKNYAPYFTEKEEDE